MLYTINAMSFRAAGVSPSEYAAHLVPALGDLFLPHSLSDHSLPQSDEVQSHAGHIRYANVYQLHQKALLNRRRSHSNIWSTSEVQTDFPYSQLGSNSGNFWKAAMLSPGEGSSSYVTGGGRGCCMLHTLVSMHVLRGMKSAVCNILSHSPEAECFS